MQHFLDALYKQQVHVQAIVGIPYYSISCLHTQCTCCYSDIVCECVVVRIFYMYVCMGLFFSSELAKASPKKTAGSVVF